MKKKMILVEFNELTPKLMHEFIADGQLPNFKKFNSSSQVYTTDSKAEGEALNPWIQWVTVHTGLSPDEHEVFLLSQLDNFKGDFIWDTLSKAGIKSWICGSMNAKFKEGFNGYFLPDPWSNGVSPFPEEKLSNYFDFVQKSVQGHSNKSGVSSSKFLSFMLGNGLSVKTILKICKQILSEKILKKPNWKRATILDELQFDVFKHYYLKEKPEFATFFSNSTAHFQHHYWKDMDPEIFGEKLESVNQNQKDAILTGYKNMDDMLGRIVKLADDDTVIVFVTALSQKPYLKDKRHYYHITSEKDLKQKLELTQAYKYKPVMAEQFHLECKNEEDAIALHTRLEQFHMDSDEYFHVGSKQVFLVSRDGNQVFAQCRCSKETKQEATFIDTSTGQSQPFYDIFYHMDGEKTGMHDPMGMLWVLDKSKAPQTFQTPVPLESIKEMVMENFELTSQK
jgi:hypothetical protein